MLIEDLSLLIQEDRQKLRKILSTAESLKDEELDALYYSYRKLEKRPLLLGITGTPGAGKSTFLDAFLTKNKQLKIGLLLIDPSSPNHQGSLLGDRVRLSQHYLKENIFIRSISNRAENSGLNPHIEHYLMIFSHYPFDVICLETVGGGQANTEIQQIVDHTILIHDPFSGDSVLISKKDLIDTRVIKKSIAESVKDTMNIFDANFLELNSLNDFFAFLKTLRINKNKGESLIESAMKKVILGQIRDEFDQLIRENKSLLSLPDKTVQEMKSFFIKKLKNI
jgi:putative protein kinase ArgK-like GTPase of G3E family